MGNKPAIKDLETALRIAVLNNDSSAVNKCIGLGARVNRQHRTGTTPLAWACSSGFLEMVDLLLAHGAGIEYPTLTGDKPLMVAALHGHASICELLVERGANVNATCPLGRTALMMAACSPSSPNDLARAATLLIAAGADPFAVSPHFGDALFCAAAACSEKMCLLLLGAGLDPRRKTLKSKSPIDSLRSFIGGDARQEACLRLLESAALALDESEAFDGAALPAASMRPAAQNRL